MIATVAHVGVARVVEIVVKHSAGTVGRVVTAFA